MFRWKEFSINRFYGLDLKTNVVDVINGKSVDLDNVYLGGAGWVCKRPGTEIMFESDEAIDQPINEIGAATLLGNKYYFKFVGGVFKYATSRTGATTTIAPVPAIATDALIWWTVLDDKLFFVDGTNALRFFDGTAIKDSAIPSRPTVAPTTASGGTGFDYSYTVDNGLGESPAVETLLINKGSLATIVVAENYGPASFAIGDTIRVYSKATTVSGASKLIATHVWDAVDAAANQASIVTSAISDSSPQLYTELSLAVDKTAVVGLAGIVKHYNRLVGWKGSTVYNSKSGNPHSWPDDNARSNAFVYTFGEGDGEDISCCVSYRESLVVLKPSNVAVFGGIGPDDTGGNGYSFRRLETNGKGCIAPKSAVTVGEEGSTVLTFLSRQGFMATDGSNPLQVGEEIQNEIRTIAANTLALSVAVYDQRLGIYCCAVGIDAAKKIYVLDARRDMIAGESVLFGWFRWSGIPASTMYFDEDRILMGTTTGLCLSQRIAGISTDFRDVRQEFIETAAINIATNRITVASSYTTGDPITLRSNGTLPAGLIANGTYYAIRISNTLIQLANSLQDALNGIAIDLTDVGVGTHSIVGSQPISAFYTTNWIHFDNPLIVKKLSKPGFVFNAVATTVNLTVQTAYDWVSLFRDDKVIGGGADQPWGEGDWGNFVWAGGRVAKPVNYGLKRRKVRSIRFKFSNAHLDQDFLLQAINLPFAYIRNRGNFAP